MAKQSRPGISGYPTMPSKPPTAHAYKEPFNLGPLPRERGLAIAAWIFIGLLGAALGLVGLYAVDTFHRDEVKRVWMGQCVVVKDQTEKRCEELWRHRLDK